MIPIINFAEKLPDDIPIVPLSSIEETSEEALSDLKKESKGSTKDKDGRGSTPPSKTLLKQLMKNRERVKESLSSLKMKPANKMEIPEDKNKLSAESHHNDELVSVSSGISDTRSVGSDSETIPLTTMNRSTINSLGNSVSDGFNSEHGYSNGNDHKINEANIPLISESDKTTTHLLKSNDYQT